MSLEARAHSRAGLTRISFVGAALLAWIAVLIGPPQYPHLQYRAALLTLAVSSTIGLATQSLAAGVRA